MLLLKHTYVYVNSSVFQYHTYIYCQAVYFVAAGWYCFALAIVFSEIFSSVLTIIDMISNLYWG